MFKCNPRFSGRFCEKGNFGKVKIYDKKHECLKKCKTKDIDNKQVIKLNRKYILSKRDYNEFEFRLVITLTKIKQQHADVKMNMT